MQMECDEDDSVSNASCTTVHASWTAKEIRDEPNSRLLPALVVYKVMGASLTLMFLWVCPSLCFHYLGGGGRWMDCQNLYKRGGG